MIERVFVPAAATFFSLGFFLTGLIGVSLFFLSTAIPCRPESLFFTITRIAALIALFAGAISMERLKLAPSTRKFMIGLAVPLSAVGFHAIAMQQDHAAQTVCLEEKNRS